MFETKQEKLARQILQRQKQQESAANKKDGAAAGGAVKKPKVAHSKHKTYEELTEIEEKKKAEAVLEEAEERARREASERFWAWTKYIPTPKRVYKWVFPVDFYKRATVRLNDATGKSIESFKYLHVTSKNEKREWYKLWYEMDRTLSNNVSYGTFCRYFNMPEDMWSRRMFDLANETLDGSLRFHEFLSFCCKYLYIDRKKTEEFSFRMVSRRGSTFKAKLSVLDLEDMKQFVRFRFKLKDPKEIHRSGLDVLNYIDTDGDGSLYLDEWEHFTKRNTCFVRFTHLWQQHMRKTVFGFKYWVHKSRQIKVAHATGLDNLTLFHRINLASETFCRIELENPVVDERGRVVVVLPYAPPRVFVPSAGAGSAADGTDTGVADGAPTPAPGAISAKTAAAASPAVGSAGAVSAKTAVSSSTLPPLPPIALAPSARPNGPPPVPPGKTMLAWHGPLSVSVNMALSKPFEREFSDLHILKLERRAKRKEQKLKDSDLAKAVAAHTYKRLVKVCEDLIYGRKWLRVAFDHWVETVGMELQETAAGKHSAEEKRLVARKRMAKLITKENVKEISLRDVGEANMSKLVAEEQAQKAAAMFGPKDGLAAVAAKLEEQGGAIDDMHSRIVDNCRKQEEQLDDPDDQCAIYVREVFMRRHLQFMHASRHERLHTFQSDRRNGELSEETRSKLRERLLPAEFNYKLRLQYDETQDGSDEGEQGEF